MASVCRLLIVIQISKGHEKSQETKNTVARGENHTKFTRLRIICQTCRNGIFIEQKHQKNIYNYKLFL
jgi:hypothetical protein